MTGMMRKLTWLSSQTRQPDHEQDQPAAPRPGGGDPHAVGNVLVDLAVGP